MGSVYHNNFRAALKKKQPEKTILNYERDPLPVILKAGKEVNASAFIFGFRYI